MFKKPLTSSHPYGQRHLASLWGNFVIEVPWISAFSTAGFSVRRSDKSFPLLAIFLLLLFSLSFFLCLWAYIFLRQPLSCPSAGVGEGRKRFLCSVPSLYLEAPPLVSYKPKGLVNIRSCDFSSFEMGGFQARSVIVLLI